MNLAQHQAANSFRISMAAGCSSESLLDPIAISCSALIGHFNQTNGERRPYIQRRMRDAVFFRIPQILKAEL